MKTTLHILLLLLSCSLVAQNENIEFQFSKVKQHFSKLKSDGQINNDESDDKLYKSDLFEISISSNPLDLKTNHFVIDNPYGSDYPIAKSVIYNNHLIALFGNGKFACIKLDNLARNVGFEKILNSKKFNYHWVIDNKLHGLSGNNLLMWNEGKWEKTKLKFPMSKQPVLYDDENYLSFSDCHDEWGGTIYFYDKVSNEIHYTEASCANTVLRENNRYLVLSNINTDIQTTKLIGIKETANLPIANKSEINKTKDGEALGKYDNTRAAQKFLEVFEIELLSLFKLDNRSLYLTNCQNMSFLAEIRGRDVQITHPLFSNNIYSQNTVTRKYGDHTLINLNNKDIAKEKEISVILINNNGITKLDWNKNQNN